MTQGDGVGGSFLFFFKKIKKMLDLGVAPGFIVLTFGTIYI